MNIHAINGIPNGNEPWLEIIENPQSRGFRFRYQCEGPSHGGLQGENSKRDRKTYPTVKIHNYKGPARIVVMLVTDENKPHLHAHELMGKNCSNGICMVDIKNEKDGVASFPNLGIRHVTKKKVVDILKERITERMRVLQAVTQPSYNPTSIHIKDDALQLATKQAEDDSRNMQLNVVRLCFRAFVQNPSGGYQPLHTDVVSSPIYDSKSPGASALKICRMDKNAGCCLGSEEVFLLCDKVQKDDIAVRFFEQDEDGQVKWEGYGDFGPNDVHRQYAIVFKTPQYHDTEISKPAHVHVQLKRISDGETSDPKPFTYYPQQLDQEEIDKKKKKQIHHFGGGSMLGDIPSFFAGFQGSQQENSFDTSSSFGKDTDGSLSRPYAPPMAQVHHQLSLEDTLPVPMEEILANPAQYLDMSNIPQPMNIDRHMHPIHLGHLPQEVDVDAAPQDDIYMDFNLQPLVPRHINIKTAKKLTDLPTLDNVHHMKEVNLETGLDETVDIGGEDVLPEVEPVKDDESSVPVSSSHNQVKPITVELQAKDVPTKPKETKCRPDANVLYSVAGRLIVALHNYAITGEIKCILTELRYLIGAQDEFNDNCLHVAVIHKSLEAVENLLLALDTLPDTQALSQYNNLMQTPLHLATVTRQPDSIQALIQHGADLSVVDRHGENPLHIASVHGYTDCLQIMLDSFPESDRLRKAQCINARDFQGFAPLHLAVLRDHLKCLRLLCEVQSVDVNIPDGCSGRTPLHHAIETNNLAIVGYLILEVGVDVNQPMFDGNTALHVAAMRNMHGIAALLMTADADPDVENLEVPMVTDDWSDEDDMPEKHEDEEEFVGSSPLDYAFDEKMARILNGEPYTSGKCELGKSTSLFEDDLTRLGSVEQIKSFYESGIGSLRGDLTTMDALVRAKLSHELDPLNPGQDWIELSRRLGLAALNDAFKMESSPTKTLLKNYETLDGTVEELCACLESMGHLRALHVLDEVQPEKGQKHVRLRDQS